MCVLSLFSAVNAGFAEKINSPPISEGLFCPVESWFIWLSFPDPPLCHTCALRTVKVGVQRIAGLCK